MYDREYYYVLLKDAKCSDRFVIFELDFSSPIASFPFKDILYGSENSTHPLSLLPSTRMLNEQEEKKEKKERKEIKKRNKERKEGPVQQHDFEGDNLNKTIRFRTLLSELTWGVSALAGKPVSLLSSVWTFHPWLIVAAGFFLARQKKGAFHQSHPKDSGQVTWCRLL